jgi:tRNA (guanosine-2'-O-)-methyltransferase
VTASPTGDGHDAGGEDTDYVPPDDGAVPADAWRLLNHMLTDTRRERMLQVAAGRTRRFRLVLQDIHNPHNVSAGIRSADAFGIQDVDVVTMKEKFRPSTVARGVAGWLTVRRWQSAAACATALKAEGYLLAAGLPTQSSRPLSELPVDRPLAVVFGNEHDGIHPDWRAHLDLPFTIPMVGMVESLNISVSAAITLFDLTQRAQKDAAARAGYFLPESEREALLSRWTCRQLRAWPEILSRIRSGAPGGTKGL